jgi:hypothetical protein
MFNELTALLFRAFLNDIRVNDAVHQIQSFACGVTAQAPAAPYKMSGRYILSAH